MFSNGVNSFFFKLAIFSLFFLLYLGFKNIVNAEDYLGKKIIDISVKGNKTINEKVILNKIRLTKGSEFSAEILKNDFKKLYETDLFRDIKIDVNEEKEGIKITFIVEENTRVKQIEFEGNDKIKSKELTESLKELPTDKQFRRGKSYNPKNLEFNIQKIKDFYKEKGFYFVEIESKEKYIDDKSFVNITFKIKEGSSTQIRQIKISGNKVLSEYSILKELKTWHRYLIFFHDRVFQGEDFKEDLKKITDLYDRNGYVKAKIKSYNIEEKRESYIWNRFTVRNTWLDISIEIEEGDKYYFKDVNFTGRTKFPGEEENNWRNIKIGRIFKREVRCGDIYSNYRVNEIIENIRSAYSEIGYIYCDINPRQVFDEEKKEVSISFEIAEGIQVFLERLEITGNKATKDKVIRREFVINPGDIFNGNKVRRSVQKIFNLGYFGDIQIDTRKGSAQDRLNLLLNVKEKPTGRFTAGIGYSSVDKLVGQISLNKENLFGNGQEVSLSWQLGKSSQKYQFSFTDPYIFDTKNLFGFDIYNTMNEIYGEEDVNGETVKTAYQYKKKGCAIRLGRSFSDYVKTGIRYNTEFGKYNKIDNYSPPSDLKELEEKELDISIRSTEFTLTRDSRDNYFFPTSGSYNTWSITYAGGFLGGTNYFVKNTLETRYHFLTFFDFVLMLRARAGYVNSFGGSDEVPRAERFDIGGAYTVRGYDERKIADGKRTMLVTNIEYMVPLADQLRGLVFWDAGNGWDELHEAKNIRFKKGVGIGLRIDTPVFPIMLDYGWGLNEGGESRGLFHFNLGMFF